MHRAQGDGRPSVRCAIVTVSDSRTAASAAGGLLMGRLPTEAGHLVIDQAVLPTKKVPCAHMSGRSSRMRTSTPCFLSGGTGLDSRDRSMEAVRPPLDRDLPGFGELFRVVLFQEQVGTAAILTRAIAGGAKGRLVVSMPGSASASELVLLRILVLELRDTSRELSR